MQKFDGELFFKRTRTEFYRNFSMHFLGKMKYDDLFWKTYYWLDKTRSWSLKQFREYQIQELQRQIDHAYRHTTYYKRMFDENGWKPKHFQDFRDFRKIPLLTKEEMREHLEELRALPKRQCFAVTTGGSTGIPTKIYHEVDKTVNVYRAFVWQWYNEGGYYLGDKAAILRGSIVKKGCCEFISDSNELHCSSMKMSENNMQEYLHQMEKHSVTAICAYPTSAELLAKYVESKNISFNENSKIKSLFTSSETLTDKARKLIEKTLNLRVYDLYGNSEQMGMIGQFQDGLYHEYMCHSYVEYLDEYDRPVKNGRGRIIATGFINRAMPILRYDTDDFAEICKEMPLVKCNTQKVVKNVYGRREPQDLIFGRDGNQVNIVAINSHADIFDHIYKLQFVQEEKGKIKLNLMPDQNFTQADFTSIRQEISKRLGETFTLDVAITDQFEYTARGKEKLLIQKLVIRKE